MRSFCAQVDKSEIYLSSYKLRFISSEMYTYLQEIQEKRKEQLMRTQTCDTENLDSETSELVSG